MLVGRVLAVQAVEVAAVEEYGKVVVSDLRAGFAGVSWIPCACARWAEPSGAAVCDLWVQIAVESGLTWTRG